jgi:hypothetical protein
MTNKVNGYVASGEFVGGDMQFFTVTLTGATWADAAATDKDAGKKFLDVAVEVIQGFETPVMISQTSATVLKFATTRKASFVEAGATGDPKQVTLDAALEAALPGSSTVVVAKAETL